jgi:hypothetical protein
MNAPAWFLPVLSAAAMPLMFLSLVWNAADSRAAAGDPEPVVLRVYTDYV